LFKRRDRNVLNVSVTSTVHRRGIWCGLRPKIREGVRIRSAIWLCASLFLSPLAGAHEDILRQIRMLEPQIASSPQNADLLLKRANLFRRHQEWERALSDLDRAAAAGADRGTISLARAQTELERKRPGAAIEALDLANWNDSLPPAAQLIRARANAALGRHAEADRDFAGALERLADARPDYYLEWAGAVAASGEAALPSAISLLDAGLVRFPGAVTLQERAVDHERRLRRFAEAVQRVEAILRTPAASIHWRVVRADLLAESGRAGEAAAAYRQAAEELRKLPARRRSAPAMQRLAVELNARVAALPTADKSAELSKRSGDRPQ
jgi:predicted Zn-dependent protease